MSRPTDKMERLAAESGDKIYLKYPHETGYRNVTYAEANRLVHHTASILDSKIDSQNPSLKSKTSPNGKANVVVAVLGQHGATMLFNLWAVLKLDCTVFPLSPRNSQEGLIHILKQADVRYLISQSGEYRTRAEEIASALDGSIQLIDMVEFKDGIQAQLEKGTQPFNRSASKEYDVDQIAAVLHTSGSTNLPKPIWLKISGLDAVGGASFIPSCVKFMTTGLIYHSMGFWVAICALSTANTVVFINCKDPLNETAEEVLTCIEETQPHLVLVHPIFGDAWAKRITEGDERVVRVLKTPILVNITGSKVHPDTAHVLRNNGVPMVSTYAGTEFAMPLDFDPQGSSYDSMKQNPNIPTRFVEVDHENPNVKELLVGPNPSLAAGVSNLPDGWYATNDLFEETPAGSGSWTHCGRKDQMMIHTMGLNTPPEPMEAYLASDIRVRAVLAVGNRRPLPGVIIEPEWSQFEGTDEDVQQYMWNLIEALNKTLPAHSRISPHTIYILPRGSELPRTDKNSIKRGLAARTYEKEIEQLYQNYENAKSL